MHPQHELREACGLFGIYAPEGNHVAKSTYFGLYALQHRGQESAGIAVADGEKITLYAAMGLVPQVFNEEILASLKGYTAIGHVRYSTTGSSILANAQPLVVNTPYGEVALGHNGNLVNTADLREKLKSRGFRFKGTSDSEVIAGLISLSSEKDLNAALLNTFRELEGAYSLVMMTKDKMIGVRDPFGVRPLCLGKIDNSYVIASESCALDIIGARFIRDILPGEMVIVDKDGLQAKVWASQPRNSLCVFEFIYFARPDSTLHGRNLYDVRYHMGQRLAREHPISADLIVPVPDSGIPAAIGFSAEIKIPFAEGLIKNRYVGRTFIQPSQAIRDLGVKIKLNPIREVIRNKRVVIVDDSIVRGTTSRQIVKILREAGAREVHVRVSSPPIKNPCYYGIDTATRSELIAANLSIEGIREYLDADSLGYLSLKGMLEAINLPDYSMCLACLNGDYPIQVSESLRSLKLIFK